MANTIRTRGESKPSLQELRELLRARDLVSSIDEAEMLIDAFLVKAKRDREAIVKEIRTPGAALLGEIKRV
jgi:hypothetical protein